MYHDMNTYESYRNNTAKLLILYTDLDLGVWERSERLKVGVEGLGSRV